MHHVECSSGETVALRERRKVCARACVCVRVCVRVCVCVRVGGVCVCARVYVCGRECVWARMCVGASVCGRECVRLCIIYCPFTYACVRAFNQSVVMKRVHVFIISYYMYP